MMLLAFYVVLKISQKALPYDQATTPQVHNLYNSISFRLPSRLSCHLQCWEKEKSILGRGTMKSGSGLVSSPASFTLLNETKKISKPGNLISSLFFRAEGSSYTSMVTFNSLKNPLHSGVGAKFCK